MNQRANSQLHVVEEVKEYDQQLEDGLLDSIGNRYRFQLCNAQQEYDRLSYELELNRENFVFYAEYLHQIETNVNTDAEALNYINKELHRLDGVLIDMGLRIESCDYREQNMKKYGIHIWKEELRALVQHSVELRKNEATLGIERKVLLEIKDVVNNIINKGDNNESE